MAEIVKNKYNAAIKDPLAFDRLDREGRELVDGSITISQVEVVREATAEASVNPETIAKMYHQELGALRKM